MNTAPSLYDTIGVGYRNYRQPDPRIAVLLAGALGDLACVLNVGAGAGSYEPRDRFVVAIEPSETMIRQRPAGAAPAVLGTAMTLPFADRSFNAAMAILTIHHWPDRDRGITELKRVARNKVVILTWEPPETPFWLMSDYLPHFLEWDIRLFPPWFRQRADTLDIITVPIPADCTDGFLCAYWARPAAYLDALARNAISTFSRVGDYENGLRRLAEELDDGTWHRRYGHLLEKKVMDYGYRIVVIDAG